MIPTILPPHHLLLDISFTEEPGLARDINLEILMIRQRSLSKEPVRSFRSGVDKRGGDFVKVRHVGEFHESLGRRWMKWIRKVQERPASKTAQKAIGAYWFGSTATRVKKIFHVGRWNANG